MFNLYSFILKQDLSKFANDVDIKPLRLSAAPGLTAGIHPASAD